MKFKKLLIIAALIALSGCTSRLQDKLLLDTLPKTWICDYDVKTIQLTQSTPNFNNFVKIKVNRGMIFIYDDSWDSSIYRQIELKTYCNS